LKPFKPEFLWSGEHWILYLKTRSNSINSVSISLYKTNYSHVGTGIVCLLETEDKYGIKPVLLTDNKDVANFVIENIISWKVSPFKKNIVIKDAKFEFKGDIRINPEWHIYFDEKIVVASWLELEDAILLNNNIQNKPSVINSILKFSDKAFVNVNGVKIDGEVFLRNEWTRLIGEPKSSSCFALSETIS
tara:strand:- start:207 stop:776 length:570 start_codon:yes stop_codon:yes gene_type:complete